LRSATSIAKPKNSWDVIYQTKKQQVENSLPGQ